MNCFVREEDLALYVTRDLDFANNAAISAHLESCSECRARLIEYGEAARLMKEVWEPPVEEDLRRAMDGVRSAIRERRNSQRIRAVWAVAASVAAAVAIPTLFWHTGQKVTVETAPIQSIALVRPVMIGAWSLPNLHSKERTRNESRRPVMEAGLRSVSLTTNSSGTPELRLTTADPDVVILLPMDESTHAN